MSELKPVAFKFSETDNEKLNALVEAARMREANSMFPLRINRTSLLQQLIHLAFVQLQEDQASLLASVARAKKRRLKKRQSEKLPFSESEV